MRLGVIEMKEMYLNQYTQIDHSRDMQAAIIHLTCIEYSPLYHVPTIRLYT